MKTLQWSWLTGIGPGRPPVPWRRGAAYWTGHHHHPHHHYPHNFLLHHHVNHHHHDYDDDRQSPGPQQEPGPSA